jgi:hypothetical protein
MLRAAKTLVDADGAPEFEETDDFRLSKEGVETRAAIVPFTNKRPERPWGTRECNVTDSSMPFNAT